MKRKVIKLILFIFGAAVFFILACSVHYVYGAFFVRHGHVLGHDNA